MIQIVNAQQGSSEWLEARMGRITGSRLAAVLDRTKKGEEGAKRRDLKMELACEILTGTPAEPGFISNEMRWGSDNEPLGRAAAETARGYMVDEVGFILHPTNPRFGVSPDGLINPVGTVEGIDAIEGCLEVKCPKTATHIGYLLAGVIPDAYEPQMMWEMACTGARWCDFVSFDPRCPEHLQVFIKRLERDNARIAELEREALAFLSEVDALIARLPKAPQPVVIKDPNPDEKLRHTAEEIEELAAFYMRNPA